MTKPHNFKIFTRRWVDEDTNIQYSAKTAVFLLDIENVEEYVFDKVKSDKPLVYIMTERQTILVEGDFDKICNQINQAKEIDYLRQIQHLKN